MSKKNKEVVEEKSVLSEKMDNLFSEIEELYLQIKDEFKSEKKRVGQLRIQKLREKLLRVERIHATIIERKMEVENEK